MRVAFYAPLKSPLHARPSGDRTVGRLLMAALERAGCEVALASRFRSRDGNGDAVRQRRIQQLGITLAGRWLSRCRQPPDLWFTYHLYHKAPDWLGPVVSARLGIPYVVAEASHAPARAGGPWAQGHHAVAQALARAHAVFSLNADDEPCVLPLLAAPTRLHRLAPFLDLDALPPAPARDRARETLAGRTGADPGCTWIACVAMMRAGDKLASYRLLGSALQRLGRRRWQLFVAGDGEARASVEQAFAGLAPGRVHLLGECSSAELAGLHAAADLCAWPAVGEAYGMALLEAQARGLPVVAARTRGVPGVVEAGVSGLLVPPGDVEAFAAALDSLLRDPARRTRMGEAARARVLTCHGIDTAAATLASVLRGLVPAAAASRA